MHAAMKWLCVCLVIVTTLASISSAGEKTTVVHPQDTGAVLINPGMGWVLHHYDNSPFNYGGRLEPSDTVDDFPGVSVIYLRIAWSYLEPEEGRFNWSVLDTPAQRWLDKGKRIALRITCSEGSPQYATPEWVRQAGAKGYFFTGGKGIDPNGRAWEPDFDDPIFLEKLDHFLAALAQRYDGNPEVAFIDVGSFGIWGEGHTYWSTKKPYSAATVRKHIDLHTKHFKKTLLAANDDFASHDRGKQVIEYAAQQGLTLRDDSILVQGGKSAYLSADFGLPLASEERARLLKPGTYDVYVSVGTPTGTPKITLPLPDDDGHHRYHIGKLTVLSAGP